MKDHDKNFLLNFAFNGTDYAGWQNQSGCVTVQGTMESILRDFFQRESLVLSGCSRTDAGVHALGMTASFRAPAEYSCEELTKILNKRLPHNIRINSARIVPDAFSAAKNFGKAYVYAVNTGPETLFLRPLCWSWPDVPQEMPSSVAMAFSSLTGTHVFRQFTGRKDETSLKPRTIYRAEIYPFGNLFCFYLSGNGFLYKMVRRIIASLHEVAAGRLSADDFMEAVQHPETDLLEDLVAPPRGLYLKRVFYSPDEWKEDTLTQPPFFD